MSQLLKFELKKILSRKVNLIAMALGMLLIVFSNIALINGESLYLGEDNRIEGVDAIKRQEEVENALTSELSEEFLTDFLQEYQQQIQNNPSEDGYDYSLIADKTNLFVLIAGNYTEFNAQWGWEHLNDISTDNGIGFYERRMEKIKTLLNADYSYGNYTESEKEYWLQKAEAVTTPFTWGSRNTWDMIWSSIGLLFYQFFVISICLAPVFAGEYQNRTDALILSAKHGKTKLIYAKIMASFIFTSIEMALCSMVSIGINICMLGVGGWNLPVQLWNTIIPYQLTVIEACALNLLVMFLISFSLTAVSLMLSALFKSQLIALAVDILLYYGTVFMPFSKSSGLWNHIKYLLPINSFELKNVLKAYNSYQFGNVIISYLGMIIIVYVLITIICLCGAGRSFKKHQIGR